jgi:uncharacterized protein (TIGR02145 family)
MKIKFLQMIFVTSFFIASCSKELVNVSNEFTTPGEGVTFDGHHYSSIVLGNGQEWMSENLRTTIYSNGDSIYHVIDTTLWETTYHGKWTNYNNNAQYDSIYGKLYNWYVMADWSHNVCPSGWHVPSTADWATLITFLGGETFCGGIKSTGTEYWLSPNDSATNNTGFSALPGGYLVGFPIYFNSIGYAAYWWTSTQENSSNGYYYRISTANGYLDIESHPKYAGFSIRCIKD